MIFQTFHIFWNFSKVHFHLGSISGTPSVFPILLKLNLIYYYYYLRWGRGGAFHEQRLVIEPNFPCSEKRICLSTNQWYFPRVAYKLGPCETIKIDKKNLSSFLFVQVPSLYACVPLDICSWRFRRWQNSQASKPRFSANIHMWNCKAKKTNANMSLARKKLFWKTTWTLPYRTEYISS